MMPDSCLSIMAPDCNRLAPGADRKPLAGQEILMTKQGFKKSSRLLGPSQFNPVFQQATFKVSSKTVLVLAKRSDGPARLGLVIGKKNVKGAVQRNRIKRLIRECFRIRVEEFATIDMVVLARQGLDQLNNQEILTELNRLLDELSGKMRSRK